MSHPNPSIPTNVLPNTLEELLQRKAILLQEIRTQKATLARVGREVVSPIAPAADKGNSLLRAFNRGMVVFDGVMLGLKIMRKFRNLFGKQRRYRF